MDNTIRMILDIDAAVEQRLQAAAAEREACLVAAREQAAALDEARAHQTQDILFEFEETERANCEREIEQIKAEYAHQSDALMQQFQAQEDNLCDTLFQRLLAAAEA